VDAAHTKDSDIGVKKLGDGTILSSRDRSSNGLADIHAKEAAGEVRVPKPIRLHLGEYLGITNEAARWIGEITYTANHRSEAPFRDSAASRSLAASARIGRAKAKGPKMRPMIVARPFCLGGHSLSPVVVKHGGVEKGGLERCSICRQTSSKPRFCMARCKGSAATKWAEAARRMADNGVIDGGGHARMISGEVIWHSTGGAYADLSVSGLKEACTGRHTGQWKGGGKRGQLSLLRKNLHPKTGT